MGNCKTSNFCPNSCCKVISISDNKSSKLSASYKLHSQILEDNPAKEEKPKESKEKVVFKEISYNDGSKYEGEWENSLPNGKGKMYFNDGSFYNGIFIEGKANGYGEFTSPSGLIYRGEWKDDKQFGKGEEIWPDGTHFEGIFQDGFKEGEGKIRFKNGSYFEGNFHKNSINGNFLLIFNFFQEKDFIGGKGAKNISDFGWKIKWMEKEF